MRQNTGEKDVQSSRCSLSKKEVNDVEISILNAIQHMRTPILDTIMCVITKLGNAGMMKNLVGRIRPFDVNTSIQLLVARPHDYSFPSGHTAASFTAAMALYLAGENKMWKPALVLAVLIAFSRLYLYVHYPTDILGGIITGCIAAYIGYRLEEGVLPRLKWKR